MRVYGHRGYSARFPENSLLAFKKAFEMGADGVELDVRKTHDGKLVVFHDADLKRIFHEDRRLSDIDFEDLESLEFSSQKVPKLEDVLDLIPPGKSVIVEIKERGAAEDAVKIVEEKGLSENSIFSSFDHDLVEEMMGKHPRLKWALLIGEEHGGMDPMELLERIIRLRPHSVHIPKDAYDLFPDLTLEFMRRLKEAGVEIFLWNINEVETYRKLSEYVDAVITDEVELFVSERDGSTPRGVS